MTTGRPPGVQSLGRAFEILELMADAGGTASVSQLAAQAALPLPTIHRLLRTLVDLGYVRQEPSRRYTLGPRLIRLGDASSRMLRSWSQPLLVELVDALGESANLAMLDRDEVVYVGQAPSRHSMRMFTEVGRRVQPHCTAVGKAILATRSDAQVLGLLARSGMPARTVHTLTDPDAFTAELARVREQGYAVDEGEQEIGVRCVAVVVPDAPTPLAISVSGPTGRMTDALIARAVPVLEDVAARLSSELAATG
ncbi:MAG: IclR family transcriptional regulator [Actinomycetota bacterium]|nr:IclR family transcriptional regulator [Actinomycetota bacterium]